MKARAVARALFGLYFGLAALGRFGPLWEPWRTPGPGARPWLVVGLDVAVASVAVALACRLFDWLAE